MQVGAGNYVLDFAEFETNLWMILFYTIPTMVLLWQGVQGWRHGAKHKLAALVALVAGLAAAYYGGEYVGGLLPRGEPSHPFARDLVQAALAGIGAYVVLRLLAAAVLFRGEDEIGSSDRLGGGGQPFADPRLEGGLAIRLWMGEAAINKTNCS